MKYYVIAREDNVAIKEFDNLKEAEKFERQLFRKDIEDCCFEPDFYDVVDENHEGLIKDGEYRDEYLKKYIY